MHRENFFYSTYMDGISRNRFGAEQKQCFFSMECLLNQRIDSVFSSRNKVWFNESECTRTCYVASLRWIG